MGVNLPRTVSHDGYKKPASINSIAGFFVFRGPIRVDEKNVLSGLPILCALRNRAGKPPVRDRLLQLSTSIRVYSTDIEKNTIKTVI